MKINPLKTTPSDLILYISGDKKIHYFYTGFWFWKKKELEIGCFNLRGKWFPCKIINHDKYKTITYYTDERTAFLNFLGKI